MLLFPALIWWHLVVDVLLITAAAAVIHWFTMISRVTLDAYCLRVLPSSLGWCQHCHHMPILIPWSTPSLVLPAPRHRGQLYVERFKAFSQPISTSHWSILDGSSQGSSALTEETGFSLSQSESVGLEIQQGCQLAMRSADTWAQDAQICSDIYSSFRRDKFSQFSAE